ncbi:hypothetical protein Pan241w_54370 [Gimesia alba]|uniref:Uncharacterized protein n=1 Tax=Gimesia alba TaxID=2527973 RepID=A0A517RN55_9PLAN|nr:hypothetical protein [Gimesia alba]QDT45317.1 hypothetical protein Pan241w_54370 [Gimesia alba]
MTTPLDQLNFGPHNEDVQEVIAFVQSGKLLSIPFDQQLAETSGYKIKQIHTFEEIDLYRKSLNDCMDNYEPYIKRADWDDLLRNDIGKMMNYGDTTEKFKNIEELDSSLTSQFDQLWKQFFILVNDQLKGILTKDESDIIADDLYMVCKCRALFGKDKSFRHETLFPIYQAGGYPCGWEGAFPRGQVAVFVPDPNIPCRFPEKEKPRVFENLEEWKSAGEEEPELVRSQKPFSSDQPQLWHGITSLEGEYAYAAIDEHIQFALGFSLETLWPDTVEQRENELDAAWGDIAGEPIPLPERFLLTLMLKGIERTYLISYPDTQNTLELVQEIVEMNETGGFFFEVSNQNQTVRFFHYDEYGMCDEKLEVDADGIQFESEVRDLEIPLEQENLFEIVNNCFEYHGLFDLMLNYDALITGPDEQGLSTATLKRMPELKYEIDILNLD